LHHLAGRVFFSLLTFKKKSTRFCPRYLSECNVSKKRMGPVTVKTPIIWIGQRGPLD